MKKLFSIMLALLLTVSVCGTTAFGASSWNNGVKGEHGLTLVNSDGFGDAGNTGIDRMIDAGSYMYLGTNNIEGTLVYRSKNKGETWEVISEHGINGNAANVYTTTIVWFNDYLYVGTWQPNGSAQLFRARANVAKTEKIVWEQITDDGFGNINNKGFTNGIVFDGYIYIACFNRTEGSEVWRSSSGDAGTFEMCIPKGYNRADNSDSTCFYVYDGYLYVGTEMVRSDDSNTWNGTALYRTNGGSGDITWEKVSPDGYAAGSGWGWFGNNNTGAITVFNGYMYVGTWNYTGYQVWRSNMQGQLPWSWEKVVTGGFDGIRYPFGDQAVQGLVVVGDTLYCGSAGSLWGLRTGKLISTKDGVTWTKVTEEGFMGPGMAGVLWMIPSNDGKKLLVGLWSATKPSQLWIYK